ncbi:hypothetical protein ACFFSW_07380 [Saccharothrix longispora]|uniref:Uncharacterized protein n=1 Tax=Saccharothrix longispora TaxID=33920 RepID=A0ABU1PT96_9PSEU|nr:hypothetical protein [Saccharothrix longispora]MDR6593676.1 hypothetical protein [Saccharothrix longispora]
MSVHDRSTYMLHHHGSDSPNIRARHLREPHLLAVTRRVEARPPIT